FREWYLVDGKQTGLGWDYSTIATAYNLAHLQEAGLKPPSELGDKWDWNAYREYAQKLSRPGARWGAYANPSDETGWLNFARANGGDYFSADRTRCTVGSPACIEAVEFLVGLVQKDRFAPTRAEVSAGGGAVQLFVDGQLAVGTFGDWSFKDFEKKSG